MRRKDKHIINGALIGFGATSAADVFMQWLEHKDQNKPFTWESYDGLRTIKRSAVGSLIGGGIGYTVYQYKLSEEAKIPFHSDSYLRKLLTEESLRADPYKYCIIKQARDKIRNLLWSQFQSALVGFPENVGSFLKGTAINSSFDLDIILPFKRSSYESLEKMYQDVYNTLRSKLSHFAKIKKQTKAIGLSFEYCGQIIHFDIVPGREINDYKLDHDLNLYVRPNRFWKRGSQFKTNVQSQKQITVNNPKAREVIKLLKKYKDTIGMNLPSTIIEQYAVAALNINNFGLNSSPTQNLLNAMDFISRKIIQSSLIDLANSNNNLLDKVDYFQRQHISSQLLRDIYRIETNPRYIREIFG